jgi:TrmH family RNA methyltransferase
MLPSEQNRIAMVLVRARNPSNIGAVARAMHDLGFIDLRIVNEYPVPFAAAKSAVDAASVLHAAQEFASVAEAVADCTLVLGTTAVGDRVLEHPLYVLADAGTRIADALQSTESARVALLFGSEKTGLSNEELSHCQGLVTIPMNPRSGDRHLSMNLGQAAAVCLYELVRETGAGRSGEARLGEVQLGEAQLSDEDQAAPAGDLERLTALLAESFERSGYSRRHPANAREANVRRLVRRMALSRTDAAVWAGVLRQMLHALDQAGH